MAKKRKARTCRLCGCTENDCSQCIERTGEPCHWVRRDLCSACEYDALDELLQEEADRFNGKTP